MPAPTYTPGALGNTIASGTSLGASKVLGTLVDLTAAWEGQLHCKMQTGGTVAAVAGVKWEVFHVYGSTTLSSGAAAGATSLAVASAAGLQVGQVIGLKQAGANVGETVTISAISGTTLTVSATTNAYAANDLVYLVEQAATTTVQPGSAAGTYAANTVYSKELYLPQGKYFARATNLDATNAVTIEATLDTLT
jgi:hypothetical protein